jgi:hypothetical protein
MRWGKQRAVIAVVVLILVVGVRAFQVQLDHAKTASPPLQEFRYLPHGEYLRMAAIGYEHIVADLLWLRAIQVMGDRKVSNEAGQWLYHLLDVVTTLDPKFVRAYEAGGIALCTMVVLPEQSNRLLEKGIRHNPNVWYLPFILGINYYFELADDAKAAHYVAQASRLPGSPSYLASFAARLYVSAREPQAAIEFLSKTYEQTDDEQVKVLLGERLKQLVLEQDLQMIEAAIVRYREQYGHPPAVLDDLVHAGVLWQIPLEPFGGQYLYDAQTLNLRSTTHGERLRLQMNRRKT